MAPISLCLLPRSAQQPQHSVIEVHSKYD